ncbi:hypothetical protein [Candidatus Erwinia haradaeae]|uniref:hypothetical protein n=1 Tax=Candidatus Erwinia haradaeae TaxID=1922217 RepID=UPI00130091E9|nr:hypothetical protein [Candidatus Erwinia haradaeae]
MACLYLIVTTITVDLTSTSFFKNPSHMHQNKGEHNHLHLPLDNIARNAILQHCNNLKIILEIFESTGTYVMLWLHKKL